MPTRYADLDIPVDEDGDGLTNEEEARLGTNPQDPDSDNDSLSSLSIPKYQLVCHTESYSCGLWGMYTCHKEICYNQYVGTEEYPAVNMNDGKEVKDYGTDPLSRDTDEDGVADGLELRNGSDPLDPLSS
jgi:hypothetical protein